MLMITTTVRMVDGVHSHTTSTGPVVSLSLILMERPSSFKQRLINASPPSNNPNRRPRIPRHRLLRTARQPNPRLIIVRRMPNNRRIIPRRAGQGPAVAYLFLDVADDGSFRALRDGDDVADCEGGFFAAVDEGAGVQAFGCDEGFFTEFVPVGVAEDYAGEGCAATGVVDDLFDDSADVAVALCEVEVTQTGGLFVVVGVRFEDGVRAPLSPDNPTHCVLSLSVLRNVLAGLAGTLGGIVV